MFKRISTLWLLLLACAVCANAQSSASSQTSANAAATLARLPDGEAVMFVDAKRLFADALPLAAAGNPAQLTEVNRQIELFKQQTGIDARDFDVLAAALDFSPKLKSLFPPQGTLKLDPVVLASSKRGNAAQILAAARQQSERNSVGAQQINITERTTRYKNKEILRFKIEQGVRVFGFFDLGTREAAIVALDEKTVAIGTLSAVRAALDAAAGGKHVDQKLIGLATQNPNAVMGFAGIVPGYVSSRIEFGTKETSAAFRELRGFYGALETGQNRFVLNTNLQTTSEQSAANLSQTIKALTLFVPGLIAQLPDIFGGAANKIASQIENVTIELRGGEVAIRARIAANSSINNLNNR